MAGAHARHPGGARPRRDHGARDPSFLHAGGGNGHARLDPPAARRPGRGGAEARGRPLLRGVVCGLMTTAGGIGHTLPFLLPGFRTATAVASVVVAIELLAISYIRRRYMETPFLAAAFQVIVGGTLVFLAGILIG